jgi:hypothetical protein
VPIAPPLLTLPPEAYDAAPEGVTKIIMRDDSGDKLRTELVGAMTGGRSIRQAIRQPAGNVRNEPAGFGGA